MSLPLLSVSDYSLSYLTPRGPLEVLEHVDIDVTQGEVVGVVGESGSGKTSLAWAIMRYLARNAVEGGGSIRLGADDLTTLEPRRLCALRGGRLGMVFQDPSAALNPTLTLGSQLIEMIRRHRRASRTEARALAIAALGDVDLKQPEAMLARFPHQLSGGEKQRALIAGAFACRPACLIFDEPTTALDVINAAQVLDLFARLREDTGVAALYISHDLALVSRIADRVCVLEKGRIVERSPAREIFAAPTHPYTRRLVAAVPDPRRRLLDESPDKASQPLLSMRGIGVDYGRHSWLARWLDRPDRRFRALAPMDLDIAPGEIVGVVGESGSGKSTLAKALTGLVDHPGEIDFDGQRVATRGRLRDDYRRRVQLIFQHPDASLNPRHRVTELIGRSYRLFGLPEGETLAQAVARSLREVRLEPALARRYPHELSGGQKQRVAIARAFAARPDLVICDEITAALDVSVQASVIELLLSLRRHHGTAYLFITHDINLIQQIAHRIAVMYRGDLVELLSAEAMAAGPAHAYTRALLAATPLPVSRPSVPSVVSHATAQPQGTPPHDVR
ncbi:ATP-binding cassette domain-containing protein [Modicisalibacter radicis]|uniref:ATP-binding cassette domain-containing protein n=1 Tax=Halomonas sp. EAR18 TaxID=2518972 RepID=UPI00109CA254|nr:ABC transporter ATP-binding protein [Halomonas sp. EAR18]